MNKSASNLAKMRWSKPEWQKGSKKHKAYFARLSKAGVEGKRAKKLSLKLFLNA